MLIDSDCSVLFRVFRCLIPAFVVLCGACSERALQTPVGSDNNRAPAADGLMEAAAGALGEREGTILVIDPQTGKLSVVLNPRLAVGQAYPPGSAIKPFTSLAALRSGTLRGETQHQCRGRYAREDYTIVCSHPRSTTPFDLPRALAHSCNDYFARVGERLSASAFESMLAAFGFGARTGIDERDEVAGRLPQGEWRPQTALGDAEDLLVTPVQMLAAYSALVNGGRLYRPHSHRRAEAEAVRSLSISEEHRAVILSGMRGSIEFGTASSAGSWAVGGDRWSVFGKTGTSASSNGFRTQGWFIAFLGEGKRPRPEQMRLGVLVFLKRAQGATAARVARPVIEAFIKSAVDPAASAAPDTASMSRPPLSKPAGERVRVRMVGRKQTLELAMDEYLRGVVAAEGGEESESEALKALSVVARGYARYNHGRHAAEGYDYCSTTHCQRFIDGRVREAVRRAVDETADLTLEDKGRNPIESYFHASCGGATTDAESVWGNESASMSRGERRGRGVRGVRDEYCASSEAHRWVDRIKGRDLARALRSDARTDVGAVLKGIVVSDRDGSGRARWLTVEGEQRRRVRGWDFKLVVGRVLGWQLIKSTKFEVTRAGDEFHFRGSGFGHGLGLCQDGAHIAARRGQDFRQILAYYFPDAHLGGSTREAAEKIRAQPIGYFQPARRSFANPHFRISAPEEENKGEIESILRTLDEARTDLMRRVRAAGLPWSGNRKPEIYIHATTSDYIAETGLPGYTSGATQGDRIALQPVAILKRRGVLAQTLRHEYAHSVIDLIGRGRSPRWLSEGLAIHFAGEGPRMTRATAQRRMPVDEIERRLARPVSGADMHSLYAAAYLAVRDLILKEGEAAVWRRILG